MRTTTLWISALLAPAALAQSSTFGKWCGKYYQVGAPYQSSRPEGSLFDYPQQSDSALLDFQCATASSLYLSGDDVNDPPMMLVDANITHDIGQTCQSFLLIACLAWLTVLIDHGGTGNLTVTVTTGSGIELVKGSVSPGSMGNLFSFNITCLNATSTPYNLTCEAKGNGQTYTTYATLSYLPPNPYGGNTVKVDRKSGALVVRNETAGDTTWKKIIPFGFYDVSYESRVLFTNICRATT
jgi:hypothetical protein